MSKSLILTLSCLAPGSVPRGRNADMNDTAGSGREDNTLAEPTEWCEKREDRERGVI